MGVWMNNIRPGKVAEATGIGIVLLLAALLGGQWVAAHPTWGAAFTWSGTQLAWAVMVYGFIASVLPVWLLLSPRDYLSAFLKIGTILVLGVAIVLLMPPLKMPAVTQFIDGTGPGIRGQAVPVRVHHHRVRRDLRVPRAHFERHDAEDGDARERRAAHRLRLDADRVVGRPDGDDRGGDARPWRATSR